jgi:peptidylprolyl isomerase
MIRLWLAALVSLAFLAAPALADVPNPAAWRPLDPENTLYIDTDAGRIIIEMYPEVAPRHVERIRTLSEQGFYDGLRFHRVIDAFMAQGGDPLGTGEGASRLPDLQQEFLFRRGPDMPFVEAAVVRDRQGRVSQRMGFHKLLPIETQPDDVMTGTSDGRATAWGLHCPGIVSMARFAELDSANSQFFIMRAAWPALDKRYSIWGRVAWGQDTVDAFPVGEPPANPPIMRRVRVASSVPEAERTPIFVLRTDSPEFRDVVAETRRQVRRDRERVFSLCDVQIPVLVPGVNDTERNRPWWRNIPLIP